MRWIPPPTIGSIPGHSEIANEAAVHRCRHALSKRISDTLQKVVVGATAKDWLKWLRKDSNPADIGKCLNRLLTATYAPMPDKIKIKRKGLDVKTFIGDPATEATELLSSQSNGATRRRSPLVWEHQTQKGLSASTPQCHLIPLK